MSPQSRTKLLIAFGAVGVLLLLSRVDPEKAVWFPKCIFTQTTGWYCPGCGTSRALRAVTEGRIADAMRLNAVTMVALPFLALMLFKPNWFQRAWIGWTAFGIMIGFGILRNLPMWPFHLMAPH